MSEKPEREFKLVGAYLKGSELTIAGVHTRNRAGEWRPCSAVELHEFKELLKKAVAT